MGSLLLQQKNFFPHFPMLWLRTGATETGENLWVQNMTMMMVMVMVETVMMVMLGIMRSLAMMAVMITRGL